MRSQDSFRELLEYDFVVVGSGFTALAFIDETIRLQPRSRILCIERGHDDFEAHYRSLRHSSQNLGSRPNGYPDVVPNETAWRLSDKTSSSGEINACAGAAHLLGGRSHYWYGWCMRPELKQSRGFPEHMVKSSASADFWKRAVDFLNVTSVENLGSAFYNGLQHKLHRRLRSAMASIPGASDFQPAAFANGSAERRGLTRYSIVGCLRALVQAKSLDILVGHQVLSLRGRKANMVDRICTDRGDLKLSNTVKVILCAGAIPNAIILEESFPHLGTSLGGCISGHFRSHIVARVAPEPSSGPTHEDSNRKDWGFAAQVIRGCQAKTGREYHIQLSAFHCPSYESRYDEIVRELPRYGTVPVSDHLRNLNQHMLISCATLGELSESNEGCRLRFERSKERGVDVELLLELNADDRELWDLMDTANFQAIESLVDDARNIEYWKEDTREWVRCRPSVAERRSPLLVHEAGTTPAGNDARPGVVDEDFRVHGCDNVYVTGSGILPSAGSWNPTLTICAFSQELARKLTSKRPRMKDG